MLQARLLDGRLKLRHLTIVATIADQGSVVGAARTLHVTQPVVTRALHEVEEILEVELFDRLPRGVTPTIFGVAFLGHARAVLAQLRDAANHIDLLSRAEIGSVQVGTHLAGSNLLLPTAIARLKEQHPQLTVIVREATPDLLENAMVMGDLDLVVGRLAAESPARLRQERLLMEPICLVARHDHPVHEGAPPSLSALTEYPWIIPVEQTALRAELEFAFLREGASMPGNRVECTSMLTLRHLLLTTNSVAALPLFVSRTDDKLKVIDTPLRDIRRSVGVTTPADRALTPAAEALLANLRLSAKEIDSREASGLLG